MKDNQQQDNRQKTDKKQLTVFPHGFNLSPALVSQTASQRISKQSKGGKVNTTQPPDVSGFFVPAHFSGGNISLPGGFGQKNIAYAAIPSGAPCDAPKDSRQFYDCQNLRKFTGNAAMKNANNHGTATPVAANQGASSIQCNHCLIPSCVVSDTLNQAQEIAATGGKHGKADAYAELLKHFHAATLPAFIEATNGNISQLTRLLGIHRSSVSKYVESIGLSHLIGRNAQGFGKSGGAA